MAGRHRPRRVSGRTRSSIGAVIVATLAGGTFGVVHLVNANTEGSCSATGIVVAIAAAPDIAPAVTEAADRWNATKPLVGGECVRASVSAVQPAVTASALAAGVGGSIDIGVAPSPDAPATTPAVWIPDSSAWISRVQAVNRDAFSGSPTSVAASPVVVGVREADAAMLGLTTGKVTLRKVAAMARQMRTLDLAGTPGPFQLGLAEPRRDSASLAGALMLAAFDAAAQGPQFPKYSALVADYRMNRPVGQASPDSASLIEAFSAKTPMLARMTATILSEQAILTYYATSPPKPLEAIRVDQNLPSLDYPLTMVNG